MAKKREEKRSIFFLLNKETLVELQQADQQAIEHLGLLHKYSLSEVRDAPLVYFVHGRAGDMDVMGMFRRVLKEPYHLVMLQAPHPDPLGGFSWWLVDEALTRARIDESYRLFEHCLLSLESYYAIRPQSRLAFGFSQGGALLSLSLQRQESFFRGVALLATFALRDRQDSQPGVPCSQSTEVFWAHGTQDEVVPLQAAEEGGAYLRGLGFPLQFVTDEVEHKIGIRGMRELKHWTAKMLSV